MVYFEDIELIKDVRHRSTTSQNVPNIGRDTSSRLRHPDHFGNSNCWVGHEEQNQGHRRVVEMIRFKRKVHSVP